MQGKALQRQRSGCLQLSLYST